MSIKNASQREAAGAVRQQDGAGAFVRLAPRVVNLP